MEEPLSLPDGTVTFLFTDLEGSTRLLQAHPAAYRDAVRRHHELLRGAVEAHGGVVFETVGDAVYAAFARPTDAVAAALAGQRALHQEDWGEVGALRARMGLHTGEVEVQGAHYVGAPLYRCARLTAAAHGGQVVLSQAACDLVQDGLPSHTALRDLGEHRLKDLQRPERLFQLLHPDLPARFPPLATRDARPHNLPAQPTPFVGRERELAAVRGRLLDPTVRLLTLTGPGGVGKTRLALQAAEELLDAFPDGVFLVPLAGLHDPRLVPSAITQALGVREAAGRSAEELLSDQLGDRLVLLLLDNFEQILAAGPSVARLLAASRGLTVLVTSRAVLRLAGEHVLAVPPLTLPPRQSLVAERLIEYDAVRLFAARARSSRADFVVTDENAPAVAELCRRLDGLPLALELAAARVRLLAPPALLARLERRLPLLSGGPRDAPPRQQTLRAAIAWSDGLLAPEERALFRRLGVFAGGCEPEAAGVVCPGGRAIGTDVLEGLAALVDASLLTQEEQPGGGPRFAMLETVREYALERLEQSGEAARIGREHAAYYLALAEAAVPQLQGPQQITWLDRLEREHDNLRAALRWYLAHGEAEPGLRLGGALGRFWEVRGYLEEGRRWLTALCDLQGAETPTRARAVALTAAAGLAAYQGEYAPASALYEEALVLGRGLEDRPATAWALTGLGVVTRYQGDLAAARRLLEESLALYRGLRDKWGTAGALDELALFGGSLALQRAGFEESLAIRREIADWWGIAHSLHHLGDIARIAGDWATARTRYEESLAVERQIGRRDGIAWALHRLGNVAHRQGDLATARAHYDEALRLARDIGSRRVVDRCLEALGGLASDQGDYPAARALLTESLLRRRQAGDSFGLVWSLLGFAALATAQAQPERSLRLAGAAAALRDAIGATSWLHDDEAELDHLQETAQRRLTRTAHSGAWAEGRAMPLEEAIAYALEEETGGG